MQHRHEKVKMEKSPWMLVTQMGGWIFGRIFCIQAGLSTPRKNG
jgi:hypothetical protein